MLEFSAPGYLVNSVESLRKRVAHSVGIELERGRLLKENLRSFFGKIVGAVGGRRPQLFVGFDLDQPLRSVAIDAVGREPHRLPDRRRVVLERDRGGHREARNLAVHAAVVVELRRTDAHRDIEQPRATLVLRMKSRRRWRSGRWTSLSVTE